MSRYLFVYGTLLRRSRHPMARQLESRARFVAEARIAGRLYDLGRFPGIQPARDADDWVHGDLFDLGPQAGGVLCDMDAYETDESAEEAFFERGLVPAVLADGVSVEAWVYWFRGPVAEHGRIASGRYDPA